MINDIPKKPMTTVETLNLETARIPWLELQRHYARGVIIIVSPILDLVAVAAACVDNQSERVQGWLDQQLIRKATDADAKLLLGTDAVVWAVAAAPWVLVQPDQ